MLLDEAEMGPTDNWITVKVGFEHAVVLFLVEVGDRDGDGAVVQCAAVLEEAVEADMDDYAKELAVHDWLITHADYDEAELSHSAAHSPLSPPPTTATSAFCRPLMEE